jgi:hypothetical protein
MVDEITQTESISKIPISTRQPDISDGYIPKKNHITHVQRQSEIKKTPGVSYMIPFGREPSPTKSFDSFHISIDSRRTPSPTKSLKSNVNTPKSTSKVPKKVPISTGKPPIPVSKKTPKPLVKVTSVSKPPKDGIYAIANAFLHGPVLDCLDLGNLNVDQSILHSLNGTSILTDFNL